MLTPEEVEARRDLMGSVRRALQGEIPDNLYAFTCGLRDHSIYLVGYFDGTVTDEEWNLMWAVGSEVIADYPEGWSIQEDAVSIQEYKLEVMKPNGFIFFQRKRPPGPRELLPEAKLTPLQAYLAMKAFVETTQRVWDPKVSEQLLAKLPLKRDGNPTDSTYWSIWESSVNHILREANTGTRRLELDATAPGEPTKRSAPPRE
jgi:hypothetical protein